MSSILSASSSTKYVHRWRLVIPRSKKSISRPGVAITISTPRSRSRAWNNYATYWDYRNLQKSHKQATDLPILQTVFTIKFSTYTQLMTLHCNTNEMECDTLTCGRPWECSKLGTRFSRTCRHTVSCSPYFHVHTCKAKPSSGLSQKIFPTFKHVTLCVTAMLQIRITFFSESSNFDTFCTWVIVTPAPALQITFSLLHK